MVIQAADLLFFGDARRVDGTTWKNLGTGDFDATIEGDVTPVTGPGVFLPGVSGDETVGQLDLPIGNPSAAETLIFGYKAEYPANAIEGSSDRLITGALVMTVGPAIAQVRIRMADGSFEGTDLVAFVSGKELRGVWTKSTRNISFQEKQAGAWVELNSATLTQDLWDANAFMRTGQPGLAIRPATVFEYYAILDGVKVGFDASDFPATATDRREITLGGVVLEADATMVLAGESLLGNPDHTDTANRITTGEGITAGTMTFDGASGLDVAAADSPDIVGDLGVVFRANRTAGGANEAVVSKYQTTANQRSWMVRYSQTSDQIVLYWSPDGSTVELLIFDVPGHVAVSKHIGITLDVDNGSGQHVGTCWDGGNGDTPVWVVADTATGAGTTSIFVSTAPIGIGDREGNSDPFTGDIYHVAVYDGIGVNTAPGQGTLAFEINGDDAARANSAGLGDGDSFRTVSGHTATIDGNVTFTGTALLVIAADESAVLMWAGIVGNPTGTFPDLVRVSGTGSGNPFLELHRRDSSTTVNPQLSDGTTTTSGSAAGLTGSNTATETHFAVVNRPENRLYNIRVQPDGTTTSNWVDITGIGALTFTEGITSLLSLPGAVSFLAFDVSDTPITEAEATALGVALINTPLSPPARRLITSLTPPKKLRML